MSIRSFLVTGGAGFIGSALVRRLVSVGHRVRVLDDQSRGSAQRLEDVMDNIEFIEGDVRNSEVVEQAVNGMDCVCHLASINGTKFFYTKPDLVLDVGVKGIINVVDACRKHAVGELIFASSSEVYQRPPFIPTSEDVPLSIPDPLNPRYSYAAAKIISEVMTLTYGRKDFNRALIFRPHNVYGPDMGWEHVIPEFVVRMKQLVQHSTGVVKFPIQGTGEETRSFVFIEDFIDGLMLVIEKGRHLEIYHIGTDQEIRIDEVAKQIGQYFGRRIEVVPGQAPEGETKRRCCDIRKLAALGYRPKYNFSRALPIVASWYDAHAREAASQPVI